MKSQFLVRRSGGLLLFMAAALLLASAPLLAGEKEDIDALVRASKARAAIVKRITPSVVNISVEKTVHGAGEVPSPGYLDEEFFRRFFQPRLPREFKQRGLGSGSIVDKRGFVLTNNHVIDQADRIIVKLLDGREFEAKLVGADPASDLAVVKIEGDKLPVVKFGDSDKMEVGESVIAVGNPFGLEQTITAGIISAKSRSSVGVTDYEDFIQTDASINPGNSGGPLVNLRGEVVGINTAIFSRTGGNQGIGFAIPSNMARRIMTDLIENGRVTRGFLGVVIQDVTRELAAAMELKVEEGVLISNVGPDTPAGKSGILQGDVIVTFNNRPVKTSDDLRLTVAAIRPGKSVPVALIRNGKEMTISVLIEEQPDNMREAISGAAPPESSREDIAADPENKLGITLRPLTNELAKQLNYVGLKGVVVIQVAPGSPGAEAGMRQGALITQINRKPVTNLKEFRAILAKIESGSHVLFLIRLREMTHFLALKIP